jgi:hypothetical protein
MSYTDTLLASGERILRRSRQHWFVMAWNSRWAIVAVIAAVALLILRLAISGSSLVLDILGYVTLLLFVIGLVVVAWGWIRYQNEEFVITSRRIIHVSGVVNKKASDSSLEMINDAVLTESMIGRMFGFGDLDVLTASENGDERLRMLRDAKAFKKAMIEAKHELAIELERPTSPPIRGSKAPATGGSAPAPTGGERPASAVPGWGSAGPASAPPPPPAPATGSPTPSTAAAAGQGSQPAEMSGGEVTDALDRLGALRDRGVVTEEEFEAKKRELLDRL